jgi:hypothetical protein
MEDFKRKDREETQTAQRSNSTPGGPTLFKTGSVSTPAKKVFFLNSVG